MRDIQAIKSGLENVIRKNPDALNNPMVKDFRDILAENERLLAVVEEVPKTADSVYVVPLGEDVWHPAFGRCTIITGKRARPWKTELMNNTVKVSDCYSTEAAAAAAEGKP